MGFPESLAKVSNRDENSTGIKIMLRNYYRFADQETLGALEPDVAQANEESTTKHLREVDKIE